MSPVIRLSDTIYKRLENHAIGFDTPNNVIERLIDFYETHKDQFDDKSESLDLGDSSLIPINNRDTQKGKHRNRDITKEKKLRFAVGKTLNWGEFKVESTLLKFENSQRLVLCKYSSYLPDKKAWFWGVSKKYWAEWGDNKSLALIMEIPEQANYSFLLMESKDASQLFIRCSEDKHGEKKINLRFSKSNEKLLIQEWPEFNVSKSIIKIDF